VKRRLRELSRTQLLPTDIAADVVIRIRPEAYGAAFPELAADFDRAMIQLSRWHSKLAEKPSLASGILPPPPSGDA
jgi:RNase P protein component